LCDVAGKNLKHSITIDSGFIAAREYPGALLRGRERKTLCEIIPRSLLRGYFIKIYEA
jgi:hypothetical protein